MPLIFLSCLITTAKGSMKIAKSEGGKWATLSCTSLQTEAWRSLIICPDTCIWELYNILIQLMKCDPNPNLFNAANKNFQFTRSNAFSASRETVVVSKLLMVE